LNFVYYPFKTIPDAIQSYAKSEETSDGKTGMRKRNQFIASLKRKLEKYRPNSTERERVHAFQENTSGRFETHLKSICKPLEGKVINIKTTRAR